MDMIDFLIADIENKPKVKKRSVQQFQVKFDDTRLGSTFYCIPAGSKAIVLQFVGPTKFDE
jgi:hypothetical protein